MADRASLDDDTINAVCAEVERQSAQAGEYQANMLARFGMTSEAMLEQAAWRLRAYESLRKQGL